MKPGETIDVRGPSGRLQYKRKGVFEIRADKKTPPTVKSVKKLGMIAGGTGITPMFQLIKDICKNDQDTTQMSLLFANQTENDILLRQELEEYAKNYPEKLKVWFTIDKSVQPDWKYDTGFVNEDMLSKHMPAPGEDTLILMCGPPPMINFACVPNLEKIGFTADMRFAY